MHEEKRCNCLKNAIELVKCTRSVMVLFFFDLPSQAMHEKGSLVLGAGFTCSMIEDDQTCIYKGIGGACQFIKSQFMKMSLSSLSLRYVAFCALSFLMLWLPSVLVAAQPLPIVGPPTPILPVRPRFVRCRSPIYRHCFNIPFPCPLECLRNCFVDCVTCRTVCDCNFPGAVCQDPRFVGGDGNTFYFHGRKDEDFCLVSDTNLHVNGHFIGKRNPSLRRDFTWVQAVGIMFDNHKILVAAKRTSMWDDMVDRLAISFDGNPISIPTKEGAKWEFSDPSNIIITRTTNNNGVSVEVLNNFRITAAVVPITAEESKVHGYNITDDNCFAHLELGFKFFNITDAVHGVLGQTYRSNYVSKTKVNVPMPVMGGAHRYLSSGLFTTDCAVSRFDGNATKKGGSALIQNPGVLHCDSGMQGKGLVCK